MRLDERVEEDVVRHYEQECDRNKQRRLGYINKSKKYADQPDAYQMYLEKAEEVDMSACTTLKEFRQKIK